MWPALVNPWMIGLGAGALALPFIVHWLTRPRPMALPLSTMRFVREIVHQRRTSSRLRDLLVLLVRMLAVALLAYGFARPFLGSKALVAGGEAGAAARVVVLDESLSMAAVAQGISPFERGRQKATGLLTYQAGLQANLIYAGPRPRPVFDRLTTNLSALRETLSKAAPLPYSLNIQQSVNRAADLLKRTDPAVRRELVIISDFQRANWTSVDFSPLPADTLIQLENVGAKEAPGNLALTRVGVQGRAEQGATVKIEVEVGNYTPAAKKVKAEVTLGSGVWQLEGMCPKGVKTTLTGDILLPKSSGWINGEAKLLDAADSLSADDTRPFVIHVRTAPLFALITREPAAPQPTSSHFVERALVPVASRDANPGTAARAIRILPEQVTPEALGPATVLVIDHPGKLPPAAIDALIAAARRGKPLLYIAAESPDATNLKLLADAAATDMKLPVDFLPPPPGTLRKALFITDAKRDQPPFAIFGDELGGVLAPLRFSGGLATPPREGGLADDILATYSDRSAALIVTTCGAGSLAILNCDLAISDLRASNAFVPLMGELVNRLLSANQGRETVVAGDPFAVYLPTEVGPLSALKLGASKDGALPGILTEESGSVLWRSSEPVLPGIYEVLRDGKRAFALAAAIPETEADLFAVDPALLKTRLAAGRTIDVRGTDTEEDDARHDVTWSWLLVACVACLMVELLVLRGFKT